MILIPPSYWRNTSTYERTSALDAPEDDLLTVPYTKALLGCIARRTRSECAGLPCMSFCRFSSAIYWAEVTLSPHPVGRVPIPRTLARSIHDLRIRFMHVLFLHAKKESFFSLFPRILAVIPHIYLVVSLVILVFPCFLHNPSFVVSLSALLEGIERRMMERTIQECQPKEIEWVHSRS